MKNALSSVRLEAERLNSFGGMKYPVKRRRVRLSAHSVISRKQNKINISSDADGIPNSVLTGGVFLEVNKTSGKIVGELIEKIEALNECSLADLLDGNDEEDNIRLNTIQKLAELSAIEV